METHTCDQLNAAPKNSLANKDQVWEGLV